jgi:hypothetical protein
MISLKWVVRRASCTCGALSTDTVHWWSRVGVVWCRWWVGSRFGKILGTHGVAVLGCTWSHGSALCSSLDHHGLRLVERWCDVGGHVTSPSSLKTKSG